MALISDAIRATASAAIDSLMAPVEKGGLGKHCSLIMPPSLTRCPNCHYDNINKRSNGRYRTGGPQPFPAGSLCGVCMGKGMLETSNARDIVFLLNWEPKTFIRLPGVDPSVYNVQVPGGAIQAKGFLSDMADVMISRKMQVETAIAGIKKYLYTLAGEPIDQGNIIQGRYFISLWTRAGN